MLWILIKNVNNKKAMPLIAKKRWSGSLMFFNLGATWTERLEHHPVIRLWRLNPLG